MPTKGTSVYYREAVHRSCFTHLLRSRTTTEVGPKSMQTQTKNGDRKESCRQFYGTGSHDCLYVRY